MANYPNSNTIQQFKLSNGITVLVYENLHGGTVMVDGGFWAGAMSEDRATAGLAGFVSSMFMRGTQTHSFEQIYDQLESVGASLGWGGGYRLTEFSAESLVEDLPLILGMASDTVRNPIFPDDQVERLRAEALTGLQMRANHTGRMAGLRFYETLFPDHPYGRSTSGYIETISAITPKMLRQFHASHVGPENGYIVVVGGIKAADAVAQVEAAFGDWHNPHYQAPALIPDVAAPTDLQREKVTMPDKSQSDIRMGLPGPRREVPDFLHARLANTVLGVFGMMGRLGKNVREKQGLAYYVSSRLPTSLGPIPWSVSTGVAPDDVEKAIASIQDEIKRIQDEPVPEAEIADSKAYLTGSLPLSVETNGGIASIIGDMLVYNLGMDYLVDYADRLNAITQAEIQAAAQTYFSAEKGAIIVAGP